MVTDFPHLHLLDRYGNQRRVNRVLTIKFVTTLIFYLFNLRSLLCIEVRNIIKWALFEYDSHSLLLPHRKKDYKRKREKGKTLLK